MWFSKPKPPWEPKFKVGDSVYYLVGSMSHEVYQGNIEAIYTNGFYVVKIGEKLRTINECDLIHAK